MLSSNGVEREKLEAFESGDFDTTPRGLRLTLEIELPDALNPKSCSRVF